MLVVVVSMTSLEIVVVDIADKCSSLMALRCKNTYLSTTPNLRIGFDRWVTSF
jgi:hypothetical protein